MKINGVLDSPDDQRRMPGGNVCDACNGKMEIANSFCVARNGSTLQRDCAGSVTIENRPFLSFRGADREPGVLTWLFGFVPVFGSFIIAVWAAGSSVEQSRSEVEPSRHPVY
jgi:hypothetical protein